MRRITVVCAVVGLFMTAAVALGANVAQLVKGTHHPSSHHVRKSEKSATHKRAARSGSPSHKVSAKKPKKASKKTSRKQTSAKASAASLQSTSAATTANASSMLLGDRTIEALVDSNDAGQAESFPFTAQNDGHAQTIAVYLDSRNKATSVLAGLYSNGGAQAGSLLGVGTLSSLHSGAWNTVTISSTTITSGKTYWVTLMGRGGSMYFRDRSNGPCDSQSTTKSGMSALPSSWPGGNTWATCPVSAYVTGGSASTRPGTGTTSTSTTTTATTTTATTTTATTTTATTTTTTPPPPPPVPPVNVLPPQISGTTTDGQTLSTSNGTWTEADSYAYRWERCDTSGANCSNISGATAGSYGLTGADVGHTVRVVVTATSSGGSTPMQSSPTATVADPPAPTSTAAPQVSGTAQQGSTLTTTNGSWTGSPTSFSYKWEDCNSSGASCTAISGATSSSYTLAAGDVGDTIRSIVTAANAGGSASATSAQTGAVASSGGGGGTGGLPAGVSLQAIDGGQNYFGKWSNGFPTSPNYFPIGVFNQSLGYNSGQFDQSQINAYKNEGINTFVNLYNGYNSSLINALHTAGMSVLDSPNAPSYANGTLDGYVWFDEADGGNACGDVPSAAVLGETVPCSQTSDGRTPSSAIAQVNSDLQGAHGAGDPTRPDYCQYTKPVAENSGLSTAQASAYVNAGCSIVSYDSYIINDSFAPNNDLWRQYDDVQNVRSMANDKIPVWPFIEAGEPFTSNQWSGVKATPAMEVAEAWDAIIGGARGIQWFDHDFGGSSGGYAESGDDLIDSNSVFAGLQTAVKSFDNEVTTLAPVLNSSFVNGYETNNGQMNVMVKYDATDNDFYIFAAPRSNSNQSITFNLAGGYSGPVQVYDEGRTVTASSGSFTDTFSGQSAVHVYVVPNTA